MSKFADKLRSLSKSSTAPIGFHPAVSEARSPAMLLIVGLSETQVKEAKTVTDVSADAGLILSEDPSAKAVKQIVEAVGDVPLGLVVKNMDEGKMNELDSVGCDFVVFDIKIPAAILQKGKTGKFLTIEPSLDQGLVRAINSLEVDGVFISSKGGEPFIAVEHLLVYRRFVEVLEKPVIAALPSMVTKAELTSLWQVGIDGVVTSSAQSAIALTEVKKMISDLPRRPRGRRAKMGVALPGHGGLVAGEEDEEQEDV
jgi:hypothetical protein